PRTSFGRLRRETCMSRSRVVCVVVGLLLAMPPLVAQQADPGTLTLDRIFQAAEFRADPFGPVRWLDDGAAYTTLEPSAAAKDHRDVVRYDTKTGRREVLVAAERLTPPGGSAPLALDDYAWSADGNRLLVFTDSKPVW